MQVAAGVVVALAALAALAALSVVRGDEGTTTQQTVTQQTVTQQTVTQQTVTQQTVTQQKNNETETKKKQQPHIIFILIDDQGYNDVGYHNPTLRTPTLDQLAAEGVTLENYYVQPICTPTRSQLLTGRYQIHTGLQHSIIRPSQPSCLPDNMDTLPQRLRAAGYQTHLVGKWHLGFYRKSCLPTRKGFDSFFGSLTGSVDYYSYASCDGPGRCGYDLHDDEEVARGHEGQYSTTLFTLKARKILENHDPRRPLFLMLALQAVHTPLLSPPSYVSPFSHMVNAARRRYAAMLSTVDEAVLNVTSDLRRLGLYRNAVIVYSTDNGAQPFTGGSNWPLRGRKGTYWEGGVRGVAFVHSPLLRRQRRVSRALVHITDWFPTLVGLAGGHLSQSDGLDGYDVWDAISDGTLSPRHEILHNIDPLHKPDQTRNWNARAAGQKKLKKKNLKKKKKPTKKKLKKPKQGFKTKTRTKTKTGTKTGTGTRTGTKTKTETKTKTRTGTGTKTKTGTVTKTETGTETRTKTMTGTKTGTRTRTETETRTRTRTEFSGAAPALRISRTRTSRSRFRRNVDQNQNQDLDQNQNQDLDQNQNQDLDRDQDQDLNLDHNQDHNQDLDLSWSRQPPPRSQTQTRTWSRPHQPESQNQTQTRSWSRPAPAPWDPSVQAAIRVGDWKLLTGDPGHGDWVPLQVLPWLPGLPGRWWQLERGAALGADASRLKNVWLFNVTADPCERRDLAEQEPDVVRRLMARLAFYNRTAVPVYFPPDDPRADPARHGGAWLPWAEEGEEPKYDGVYKTKKRKRKKCPASVCRVRTWFTSNRI